MPTTISSDCGVIEVGELVNQVQQAISCIGRVNVALGNAVDHTEVCHQAQIEAIARMAADNWWDLAPLRRALIEYRGRS